MERPINDPKIQKLIDDCECIIRRYDAENDCIPGAPRVLYNEQVLLDMVRTLAQKVDELQSELRFMSNNK